jgi:hypothetical protein
MKSEIRITKFERLSFMIFDSYGIPHQISKSEFELKPFRISAFHIPILVYASSFPVTCLPPARQIHYSL